MSSRKNRRARRAAEASTQGGLREGSQSPGVREGDSQILGDQGGSDQEESLARHARVREGALAVDATDRRARIRFLASLGPDYERGVTPAVCAEVWSLKLSTCENDASIAWMMVQEASDPAVDHAVWWRETYDNLEHAKEHRTLIVSLLEQAGLPTRFDPNAKALGVDWMGVKAHAESLGKCHEQIMKSLEQIAKASGLITSGSQTTVKLDVALNATIGFDKVGLPGKGELPLGELVEVFSAVMGVVREHGDPMLTAKVRAAVLGQKPPEPPALTAGVDV